jgi:hypothetical protein
VSSVSSLASVREQTGLTFSANVFGRLALKAQNHRIDRFASAFWSTHDWPR